MKAARPKWKLMQHRFQHGDQKMFADFADATHHLPLRHRIHRIDMVDAFGSVPIALMHGIHAQESGPALRIWFAALPDGNRAGPRGLEYSGLLAVARAGAQLV